jgi:hypothetical protein
MQQQVQMYWNTAKVVLIFTWRHLFTLINSCLLVYAHASGGSPIFPDTLYIFIGVIAFDWIKMKFKGGNGEFKTFDHNDPYTPGTFAYFSRRNMERSSIHHY